MAATASTMLDLGTKMPDFTLPDTVSGKQISASDAQGEKGTVVAFICNHCPFVKHVQKPLAELGKWAQENGVGFVAISSNNVETHPDDAPDKMKQEAQQAGYTFPYLYDESQEIAKKFKAACTPDFYVFDGEGKLFYRGQMDDTRPDKGTATGEDLKSAIAGAIAGEAPPSEQKPSMGCNIKWKPGNEPDYA